MIADRTAHHARAPGRAIEWPTIILAIVIHAGWATLVRAHAMLPVWALVPLGGWLVAWHGSLQHETIHGHPTRDRRVNALIGGLPLSLWLPYRCYRRDHVAHHAAEQVTDPVQDPESRYLRGSHGPAAMLREALAAVQAPLLGRLVLGPPIVILGFLVGEARRAARRPTDVLRDWAPHLIGVAMVVAWLGLCHMPPALYVAAFVLPGTALSLLRSFAEHRAAAEPGHRIAVVERAGPFALLFLNNNLHAAHHRSPGTSWYRLPAFYRRHRAEILRENGCLLYRGYGEIVRRYGLRAHDVLLHPDYATVEPVA